jgi:hypothetical protein
MGGTIRQAGSPDRKKEQEKEEAHMCMHWALLEQVHLLMLSLSVGHPTADSPALPMAIPSECAQCCLTSEAKKSQAQLVRGWESLQPLNEGTDISGSPGSFQTFSLRQGCMV